jgi:hypothetical protein
VTPEGRLAEFSWKDEAPKTGDYYYVRLTIDPDPFGEYFMRERVGFVWSSPVWIESL